MTNLRRSIFTHVFHQRGHASRSATACSTLRATPSVSARPASPLYSVRCVVVQSVANAEYRDCQEPGAGANDAIASHVLRKCQSARRGAAVVSARYRIVLERPAPAARRWAVAFAALVVRARYGHPLRFYIRPHFAKRPPVATLKLRLVSSAAARPTGSQNRPYAKWPKLGRFSWVSAWHCSGAARSFPVSGLRPATTYQPRPPAAAAPPSRPPPWGSQQPGTGAALARRALADAQDAGRATVW